MLIGLLVRDRPELLAECLRTLRAHTLGDFRIIAHLDAAEPECKALVDGLETIESPERVGIAAGLNKILALREPGEDFCRVDSDVRFITHDWLRILAAAPFGLAGPIWTGNRYEEPVRDFLSGKHRPAHIPTLGPPIGGVVFHPAATVERLGGYRNHGRFYGCQERDYAARVMGLGLEIGYATGALIEHPPTPALRGERRTEIEEALKSFARAERTYQRGENLFEEVGLVGAL